MWYWSKKRSNCLILFIRAFVTLIRLASGATWQSSGRVSNMQSTFVETQFTRYSRQLYERLQKEGHDIGKANEEIMESKISFDRIQ